MYEMLKPLALALVQPVNLVLAIFGITSDEEQTKQVLLAIVTIVGVISAIWSPSFKAIRKYKGDAK